MQSHACTSTSSQSMMFVRCSEKPSIASGGKQNVKGGVVGRRETGADELGAYGSPVGKAVLGVTLPLLPLSVHPRHCRTIGIGSDKGQAAQGHQCCHDVVLVLPCFHGQGRPHQRSSLMTVDKFGTLVIVPSRESKMNGIYYTCEVLQLCTHNETKGTCMMQSSSASP